MPFLAPFIPAIATAVIGGVASKAFGGKSAPAQTSSGSSFGESLATSFGKSGTTSGTISGATSFGRTSADPVLFGPNQLRTPTRTAALEQTTPTLFEKAFSGRGQERQRLTTRAFEGIDLSTKSALEKLREIFGRSGVRGGVQGADITDIIEASLGAKGTAAVGIEDLLKQNEQRDIQNLLNLLLAPEPFALGTISRGEQGSEQFLEQFLEQFSEEASRKVSTQGSQQQAQQRSSNPFLSNLLGTFGTGLGDIGTTGLTKLLF